uniref:V-set and transmembrane domain containing 5 n=1 Tax=Anas platyrhynchos platyrhynchos TaxID=8840 RepID=A0A493TYM1_ANAPP
MCLPQSAERETAEDNPSSKTGHRDRKICPARGPILPGHSLLHHLHTHCLLSLSAPGGVSLTVPQPNINATVAQNILLSVEYYCRGVATVEWKHVSSWGTTRIVEWKSGNYVNISAVYKDRVTIFENGSIELRNVGMRDAGYYLVTVTEEYGTNTYGAIIVNVYEIIYEDIHFVAVLFAFLAAVSAILICFMWLCNKSLHLFQKTTHKLSASTTEEIELETIEC